MMMKIQAKGFTGSTVIAKFDSLDEAKQWASQDPYVEAGVYGEVAVKPLNAFSGS